ncbi:MAG TPA: hypothetical protein VI793_08480 [Anaerolineales bacterium]|nr:hypothetical protein [Anaerolineales bacterium]
MSLREELALRLQDVGADVPTNDLGGIDLNTKEIALAVADECIRQMDWARRMVEVPSGHTYVTQVVLPDGTHRNVENLRLTLAPRDWKPE